MGHRSATWGYAPKGWTILSADICWEDHGGTWAKRDKHASGKRTYHVLRFSNLTDEMREKDDRDRPYYEASTAWVDIDDCKPEEIARALASCGYMFFDGKIVTEHNGEIVAEGKNVDLAILDALASYGLDWDYITSDKQPLLLRSRAAKSC